MNVSNSTCFRSGLRLSALVVLMSVGIAALSSCTVTYRPRRPLPPPSPPEVVYVEHDPQPDAFAEIDPYGNWVYIENAGWAWQPDVRPDWRPYYHGHWVWADAGWTWVSYEPFGWAVYHYGNWSMDPEWGWVWFPSYEWQPNRVTWVVYQDHIAWAPLPYRGYVVGDPWNVRYEYAWNVCPVSHFTHHYVGDYFVHGYSRRVHRDSRYVITRAPETTYVYQLTGVQVVKIHINTHPIAGNKRGLKRLELPPSEVAHVKKYKTRTEREITDKTYGHRGKPTRMTPADAEGEVAKPGRDNPKRQSRDGAKTKAGHDGPNIISESDDSSRRRTHDSRPSHSDPDNNGKRDDRKNDGVKKEDSKSTRDNPKSKNEDKKADKRDVRNDDSKSKNDPPNAKKEDPKSKKDQPKSKNDKSKKDEAKSKKDDSKSKNDKSKKDEAKSKKDQSKSKNDKSKKDEAKSKKNGSKDKDDKDSGSKDSESKGDSKSKKNDDAKDKKNQKNK